MAREYLSTKSGVGTGNWIRVDSVGRSGSIFTIIVDMEQGGPDSATADVEFAVERNLDTAVWIRHHILNNVKESTASTLHTPITGIRLVNTSWKNGTVKLKVIQEE